LGPPKIPRCEWLSFAGDSDALAGYYPKRDTP
jgi:hypothetical protein